LPYSLPDPTPTRRRLQSSWLRGDTNTGKGVEIHSPFLGSDMAHYQFSLVVQSCLIDSLTNIDRFLIVAWVQEPMLG